MSECVGASDALTDILPRYYHAFGPAQAPPFTAYYLLTATTIQLWAWTKGPSVSTSAVQRLNQLLALFKEMAAHCPAIAKRMRLVQNTLSKRPHVPSAASTGPFAQTSVAGHPDPAPVSTTDVLGPTALDDPFALGNFLDFDFTAAYDPLAVDDITLDPALGSFANLFEAVRGSASTFEDERSPYDQTLLQDPAELLNTWAGHLPS